MSNIVKAFNNFLSRAQNVHASFNMLATIPADHYKVHDQKAITLSNSGSINAGAQHNFLISVGSESRFHLRDFNFRMTVGPGDVRLYESPFINTNSLGTALPFKNMNRAVSVDSGDISFYRNPFVDANSMGEQLDYDLQESSTGGPIKAAGGSAGGPAIEWVLNKNTDYIVTLTNSHAATAALYGAKIFGYFEG